jgi:RHS repeat-associated protein
MSWSWDAWSRPTSVTLPVGAGRGGGTFTGFARDFDSLDRLVDVGGAGANGLSLTPIGARWTWGGGDRLYAMDTKGGLGTASRWGWHEGGGPQLPNAPAGEASRWKLATLEWGAASGGSSPTASPTVSWGRFGYGWRGHEGEAADGAKLGRQVLGTTSGIDVAASLGWSWSYDAGVRLASAESGRGSVAGGASADGEAWRYGYGEGDELERIVREGAGRVAELETGIYGRILSRDGVAFAHDGAGRRTLDDRFRYRWNWRGELVEVEVLEEWPGGEVTPWAGHLVEYRYDASGRMSERWHWGQIPEGGGDRPFIERRVFVWEQARLAAEAAYGLGGEETLRWRRTYVPGPAGLDDAPQVVVEIRAIPGNPYAGTTRTYTYLRDELGTVIGLVAEDEGTNPNDPPAPVRYRYSPFGEAYAESGPRLDAARFVGGISEIETTSGPTAGQTPAPDHAAGAMVLSLSLPVDPTTLAAGLAVERLEGASWSGFDVELGHLRPPPGTIGTTEPDRAELILLPANGWPRGATYRVRLTGALADTLGRPLTEARTIQWEVPEATGDPATETVAYAQAFPLGFDTWTAAGDALSGRFPGGQSHLFQGLWTDPVTGIAHARARWYDARNAAWLSEDPLLDVDSVNLYAFVGWGPHAATDPTGEIAIIDNLIGGVLTVGVGAGIELITNVVTGDDSWDYSWKDAGVDFALGAATSGLSNLSKIKQVAKLGRVGQQGARVAAETAIDFGLEIARKEWKSEEYEIADLAIGAARNAVVGEAGAWVARAASRRFGGRASAPREPVQSGLDPRSHSEFGRPGAALLNGPEFSVPIGAGGSGRLYDKLRGQGLYVLLEPETRAVMYVGRGDAPARLAAHKLSLEKGLLEAHVIWENNLPKARAKGLEQQVMDSFGGARSTNPATTLLNRIRGFSTRNKNAPAYESAVTPFLWEETLCLIKEAQEH